MTVLFSSPIQTIQGEPTTLEPCQGKALLIVNTASQCGYTPQYAGLERLHQKFSNAGLAVLGFPCNQFGNQENGTHGEIQEFCKVNYGVTFPIFEKISVNGPETHPIFEWLKNKAPGFLGTKAIKWNFTKFLVAPDLSEVIRYGSKTRPSEITEKIEQFLSKR